MELGVQTHFSQNWNRSFIDKAVEIGATSIRDSVKWSAVETAPGVYTYTPKVVDYLALAGNAGMDTTLTFASGNALYDSGYTPFTDAGRQAYANYIVDVLKRHGGSVANIEVWNEFNVSGSLTGPDASNAAASYTALLKTVYETVKPLFPDVQILGGSVNVVATGALESIFKLGALNYLDGIAVHPYRDNPEGLGAELNHLTEVMNSYGGAKSIYATEFGSDFSDAGEAPAFMLKMVAEMSSAHVKEAYWYDLVEQSFFPNMGLYTTSGQAMPAAATFAFIEKTLIPLGDAVRVETGDPDTLIYRFGDNTYVMWGAARAISFSAGGAFFDAQGKAIAAPTSLSAAPVVFQGGAFSLGQDLVVADSLYGYKSAEWSYFAKQGAALTALTNVDWAWTSYLGSKYTKPLRVNADSIAPAGTGANPIDVVERYTSDKAQAVRIDASWITSGSGDGIDLHLLVNGRELLSTIVNGTYLLDNYTLTLAAGDTVDFVVGPNQYVEGDSTKRHITITQVLAPTALAPAIVTRPIPLALTGTAEADTLRGADTADTLSGLAGNDTLLGGGGNDLLDGGIGKNLLDGGDGFDTVSYASQTAAVSVALGLDTYQKVNAATTDRLIGIEAVIGTAFADTLKGSVADERFEGGAGDDTFHASLGHDAILGGAGTDTLTFASWTAPVTVSLAIAAEQQVGAGAWLSMSGIEVLTGGAGDDTFTAGASGSTLNGGAGDDVLVGGAGDDTFVGGAGVNTVSYAAATGGVTVSLSITAAQDTIGAGVDTIRQVQTLIGSSHDDYLTGGSGSDTLAGGDGDDVLVGGKGGDLLSGGRGADVFLLRNELDSTVAAPDTILDFRHADGDRIDLSGIDASTLVKGNNAFALAPAFTHVAGQLVAIAEAGGYWVGGDMNGDGRADFALHVQTSQMLVASDFIL